MACYSWNGFRNCCLQAENGLLHVEMSSEISVYILRMSCYSWNGLRNWCIQDENGLLHVEMSSEIAIYKLRTACYTLKWAQKSLSTSWERFATHKNELRNCSLQAENFCRKKWVQNGCVQAENGLLHIEMSSEIAVYKLRTACYT